MHAVRAPVAFDGSRFLPGGATVLVEGDLIVGVEAFGCDLPEGCTLAAYDGTVLPGLFDAHTHLVSDGSIGALEAAGAASDSDLDATIEQSLRAQVRGGVTTVRDLGDRNYRTLVARDDPKAGLPRILAAGPPLTVPDGHCHYLGGTVASADGIRRAVRERRDRGVDVVKVMASGGMLTTGTDVLGVQFSPEELRTVVEEAHDAGLAVLAHAHSLSGIEHALTAGVDGIEHFTGLVQDGLELPDEVLERTVASGVTVDPTLGVDWAVVDAMPAPPPAIQEIIQRTGLDFPSFNASRIAAVGRMREHGVRVVTGMDSGAAPTKRHGRIDLPLTDLVAAGYPMAEALATATSVAADACGLAPVTGSLRPGLAADVLVVDGDLRSGPEALASPAVVLVRGVSALS
jgi:imidazolonepropionase-like amidohydrolase